MKLFIFGILFSLSTALFAQNAGKEYFYYKRKYPDRNAIFTHRSEKITMDVKNEELHIYTKVDEKMMYLDNITIHSSKKSLFYSQFYSITNIQASIEIPKKKSYKKIPVREFIHSDNLSTGMIFHDDTKRIDFQYPELQLGAKTHVFYEEHITEPRFFGRFRFVLSLPAEYVEYSIFVPHNIEIGYTIYAENNELANIEFTSKPERKGTRYTWTAKNVQALPSEENTPNYRYYAPHILVYIKKYTTSQGNTVQIYNTISDLHQWYASLLQKVQNKIPQELMRLCDSIAQNSSNETEIVKQIYYWVQSNITYIAFADGLEGFIPRNAQTTFEKRYGDCKDVSNLIIVMLDYLGIRAHYTWIGTRDIPYTYSMLPTTSSDNHMIVAYKDQQGIIQYLDATSQYLPYGTPSGFIQGKQALIHKLDSLPYALQTVPIISPEHNIYKDSVYFTIENRKIQGTNTVNLQGYWQSKFNQSFAELEKANMQKKLTSYLQKGNNSFTLESYNIQHVGERDTPITIEANFSIQNYAVASGKSIFVNMNIDKIHANIDFKQDRKFPYKEEFQSEYHVTAILEIPQGYTVEYIPQNIRYSSDIVSFSIDYRVSNNHIEYNLKQTTNFLLLNKEHFETMHEYILQLRNAYSQTVQLISIQ